MPTPEPPDGVLPPSAAIIAWIVASWATPLPEPPVGIRGGYDVSPRVSRSGPRGEDVGRGAQAGEGGGGEQQVQGRQPREQGRELGHDGPERGRAAVDSILKGGVVGL